MKKISVVIPVYNEQAIIEKTYEKIKLTFENIEKYDYEVIFVNDGSEDKSLEILEKIASKNKKIKIISFSRNFGSQNAIIAGLKHILGNAVIIMDADLQDPVESIPDMIKLWENGYDVIYGKRKKEMEKQFLKFCLQKYFIIL